MNKAGKAITKILTGVMGIAIAGCAGILIYSRVASPDAKYEILENFASRNVSENTITTASNVSGTTTDIPVNGTAGSADTNISSTPDASGSTDLSGTGTSGGSNISASPDVSGTPATQTSTGSAISITNAKDAKKTAALVTGINASRISFYDDFLFAGTDYYAFEYTNFAGLKMNPLIIVSKADGKTFYYENSYGVKDVWTLGYGEIYSGPTGNDSFVSGDPDFSTDTDGFFTTRGIRCGMTFDQTINQLLHANGIAVDEDRLKKCSPAYLQSGDLNEATDMIGIGSQTLFGFPCEVRINFDKAVDEESRKQTSYIPYAEEIITTFICTPDSYDASRYVSKQMNQLLGKPAETFQNDAVLAFYWYGAKDTATLLYVYSGEIDDYALRSFSIESSSHAQKTAK